MDELTTETVLAEVVGNHSYRYKRVVSLGIE